MNIITLTYNPQTLHYEVGFKDFPVLDLNKYRTMLINEINKIGLAICGKALETSDFERLSRSTTFHLEMIINDQSAVLNRKRYDEHNDNN